MVELRPQATSEHGAPGSPYSVAVSPALPDKRSVAWLLLYRADDEDDAVDLMTRLLDTQTGNQHWVPQFHQRGFRAGDDERVWRWHRGDEPRLKSTKRTASCDRAYDWALAGEPRSYETVYGKYEDVAAKLLQALAQQDALGGEDAYAFAQYVMDLHTRNPRWRDDWVAAAGPEPDGAEFVGELGRCAAAIALADKMAEHLLGTQCWEVFHADDAFICSDVPVGIYDIDSSISDRVSLYDAGEFFTSSPQRGAFLELPLTRSMCLRVTVPLADDPTGVVVHRHDAALNPSNVNIRTVLRSRCLIGHSKDLLEQACYSALSVLASHTAAEQAACAEPLPSGRQSDLHDLGLTEEDFREAASLDPFADGSAPG